MEELRQHYNELYRTDSQIKGVTAVRVATPFSPLIDCFDVMVLIVTEQPSSFFNMVHYIKDNCRVQERRIDASSFERGLLDGAHQNFIHWILQGEILVDREQYLHGLRQKLIEFPTDMREQKLFHEFALFMRSHLQGKQYIQEEHVFDAYSSILEALHHWAQIAIIESGHQPEMTVWSHIRKINPGIYKLYEELTSSSESMEQRVRLVILACEFSMMSKMENCCVLLMRIIRGRQEPWSIEELKGHPDLEGLDDDLGLLLNKLVAKSLVKEVVVAEDPTLISLALRYICA